MAAPARKPTILHLEAQRIKNQIDTMISHMQRKTDYTPSREDLEYCADELIQFIRKYQKKTSPHERFLKTAIIDLSEVPEMAPQMQRISFLTALKDASKNLDQFINNHI